MAGEKDAVIELEEEGVVTIDIGGDEALAAAADELAGDGADTGKKKEEAAPVVTQQRTSKPSASDEAAAVLTQSLKNAEELRKAAEATALAERNSRLVAERTLSERDQETQALRETAANAELATITTGIENQTRAVEQLTLDIERANEAGDFKASAAAQAKLARAAAALDRLETDKANFETRKPVPVTEGRVVEQKPSPFEQYVAGFAPKAQTWLRAHPECVPAQVGGNASKNAAMMAGHYEALAQGLTEGTDDYFKVIEEKTGHREPVSSAAEVIPAGERERKVDQKPVPRKPAPSAPPSRDSEATGAQQRSVRLTPAQQEVALFSYTAKPGESDTAWKARAFGTYARELVSAQAEGKIGRATH